MDTNTQLLVEMLRQQTDNMNERFDGLQDGLSGVNARLDGVNGRTRKNESAIVRLTTIVAGAVAVVLMVIGAFIKHVFGV